MSELKAFGMIAIFAVVALAAAYGVFLLGDALLYKPCRDRGGIPTIVGCLKPDAFVK